MILFDEILRMMLSDRKVSFMQREPFRCCWLHTLTRYIRKSRVLSAVLKMDGI